MFQDMNVAKSAPSALLTIYQKSMYPPQSSQKAPVLANHAKFANLLTHLYYVSGTCPGREPCGIRANYANSAKFAHTVRELCEIRTILLTYSTLCFRHLPQLRTLRNSSELRKFRAIRPHSPRITQNSHHLLTLHITFQMPDQWQRTP